MMIRLNLITGSDIVMFWGQNVYNSSVIDCTALQIERFSSVAARWSRNALTAMPQVNLTKWLTHPDKIETSVHWLRAVKIISPFITCWFLCAEDFVLNSLQIFPSRNYMLDAMRNCA